MPEKTVHQDVWGRFLLLSLHELGLDSGSMLDQRWTKLLVSFELLSLQFPVDFRLRPRAKITNTLMCATVILCVLVEMELSTFYNGLQRFLDKFTTAAEMVLDWLHFFMAEFCLLGFLTCRNASLLLKDGSQLGGPGSVSWRLI